MCLTPELVDLKAGIARVPTAKRGPPPEIAFNLPTPAWTRLLKADALGSFSVQSCRKRLHRACRKAGVAPFPFYDLRHSFLSALRKAVADLSDVQAQAGYSDIVLMRRYAPTIILKLKRAVVKAGRAKGSRRKFPKHKTA
jgi:integrase